jgi:hypothetical protein
MSSSNMHTFNCISFKVHFPQHNCLIMRNTKKSNNFFLKLIITNSKKLKIPCKSSSWASHFNPSYSLDGATVPWNSWLMSTISLPYMQGIIITPCKDPEITSIVHTHSKTNKDMSVIPVFKTVGSRYPVIMI